MTDGLPPEVAAFVEKVISVFWEGAIEKLSLCREHIGDRGVLAAVNGIATAANRHLQERVEKGGEPDWGLKAQVLTAQIGANVITRIIRGTDNSLASNN